MKIQISVSSTVVEKLQSLMIQLQKDKKHLRIVELTTWVYKPALRVVEKDPYTWNVGKSLAKLGWTYVEGRGSEYVFYMERPDHSFQIKVHETPGSRYIIPEGSGWSEQ
jgi:hypothetical protein